MVTRGKTDAPKGRSHRPQSSPDPEPWPQLDANETLLANMRQMIDEMRSDIINRFESIVSGAVKKEITAVVGAIENMLSTHGVAIADLEHSANDHDNKLQAKVDTLTSLADSLSKKCEEGRSRWNNIRLVGLHEGVKGV